jgi:putative methionine-R-sulfoxide reductase with GAF domain
MTRVHEELLREFEGFAKAAPNAKSLMERISQRLHEKMTKYNWVGFYLVDPADAGILLVGPFVGSFNSQRSHPARQRIVRSGSQERAGRSSPRCSHGFTLFIGIGHGEV